MTDTGFQGTEGTISPVSESHLDPDMTVVG